MDSKPLTGVRKRQQIENANKQMLIWVAMSAAIVTICAMAGVNLVKHIAYQNKVIGEISKTDSTLKSNVENIPKLMENINALQTNENLLNLRADARDTAFNVVIDALPTVDDMTVLGSSLQDKLFAGNSVMLSAFDPSIGTVDATADDATKEKASLVYPAVAQLSFSFSLVGDYDSIQAALSSIEKSIRPITITGIKVQGSEGNLKIDITASTYYIPKANYSLGSMSVLPDGAEEAKTDGTSADGTKTEAN